MKKLHDVSISFDCHLIYLLYFFIYFYFSLVVSVNCKDYYCVLSLCTIAANIKESSFNTGNSKGASMDRQEKVTVEYLKKYIKGL